MTWLEDARTPDGLRIYAIGDTHGCLDQLQMGFSAIDADLAARPVADWRVILLGDLIDRGPDSPGLLTWLVARMAEDARIMCVRGNHDTFLMDFIDDSQAESFWGWASYGGHTTMAQYGVREAKISPKLDTEGRQALPAELAPLVPQAHVDLLRGLPLMIALGGYLFVHAGIRPEVPLDEQEEGDLIWIREPFLSWEEEHPHVVVHGHTPGDLSVRHNRVGIDTGLVFGHYLTCLVLEGSEKHLLDEFERKTLPDPA